MKKSFYKAMSYLILVLMLASCKDAQPQTHAEIEKFKLHLKKENLRTMFLGAINFCSETDYEAYFDNPRRQWVSSKEGGNCCTSSVRFPHINLAEYYLFAMEGDRSVFDNQNDPFKLKKIRKELEVKIRAVKDKAKKLDPKKLIFLGYRNALVSTYDMDKEILKLYPSSFISFDGTQGDWLGKINYNFKDHSPRVVSELDLPADEAEKLFEYFDDNNERPNLASSKYLNTKITYALEKPKRNDRLSRILVTVKKVEFYYPDNWDNKIGEVTF
ncbi:hypothetical protein MHTCC0001_09760 [Flavobacteriaceae bacterium MHTCC 0001]